MKLSSRCLPFKLAINLALILMVIPCARAHHGVANFDLNNDLELTGKVARVDFINPHSWLYLDVTNDDQSVTQWRCEMRGVTVLRRSGWSEQLFPVGLQITITGSPDRKDPRSCYLGTVQFADGTHIDRYGQITKPTPKKNAERPLRLANGNPNIAGDWAAEQMVMTDPRGLEGTLVPISTSSRFKAGEVPQGASAFPGARGTSISKADDPVDAYWNQRPSGMQLTAAGNAAIANLDLSGGDNPRLRCAPTNILFDWYFEMDINRITQNAEQIKMYYGSQGIERIIHLDMNQHPDRIEPSIAGHSIGYWDNDVLVVDTIGFKPGILNADRRIPHSGQLHIVERFILDTEKMSLRREHSAEDALYYSGQYTGSDTMLVSELPYHGTTACEERTNRTTPSKQE